MADKIAEIYAKARQKGILTNGLTEDMFREQTKTDEGLRSFYDIATANGMKFHPYDEFKGRFYGTQSEEKPQSGAPSPTTLADNALNAVAEAKEPAKPVRISTDFANINLPTPIEAVRAGQDNLHNNINKAWGVQIFEKPTTDMEAAMIMAGEQKTPEDLLKTFAQAWSEHSDEGKAMLKNMEDVYNNTQNAYLQQFQQTKEYADLVSKLQKEVKAKKLTPEQAGEELSKLFVSLYGNRLEEDRQNLYFDYLKEAQTALEQSQYKKDWDKVNAHIATDQNKDLNSRIDAELEKRTQEFRQQDKNTKEGFFEKINDAYAASRGNLSAKAQRELEATKDLQAAKAFATQAEDMIASVRESKNFFADFGKSFGKTITSNDTWDLGVGQLMNSIALKNAADKADKGESLTHDEELLLEAAANYMAVSMYYSDKVGRGTKAGQATAASIPFMLEFMLTSGVGAAMTNATTRGITRFAIRMLGNGARKKGVRIGAEVAGKALSDIGYAELLTNTLSAPKIAEGTISRMNGSVKPQLNDTKDGFQYDGRTGQQGLGEALWNAHSDQFIENYSEVVFGGFDPLKEPAKAAIKSSKVLGKMAAGVESNAVTGTLIRAWNNPTAVALRKETRFGGLFEETMEEEVGGLFRLAANTDVNNAKDAGLDIDSQIDIILGLAPSVLLMSGAGATFHYSKQAHDVRKMREYLKTEEERQMFDRVMSESRSGEVGREAHDFIREIVMNNDIPNEAKRQIILQTVDKYKDVLSNDLVKQAQQIERQDRAVRRETAIRERIGHQTNESDGQVYRVSIAGNDTEDNFIKKGNIVINEDGTIDKSQSDGYFVVATTDKDGNTQIKQVPVSAITNVEGGESAEDIAQTEIEYYNTLDQAHEMFPEGSIVTIPNSNGAVSEVHYDEQGNILVDVEGGQQVKFTPQEAIDKLVPVHEETQQQPQVDGTPTLQPAPVPQEENPEPTQGEIVTFNIAGTDVPFEKVGNQYYMLDADNKRTGRPFSLQDLQEKGAEPIMEETPKGEQIDITNPQPIGTNEYGNIYQWVVGKAKEAAQFLRKHKDSYLKGVFYRDDIGDIDLVWGNDKAGLQHIVKRHILEQTDFDSINDAIEAIEKTIKNGKIDTTKSDFIVIDNGKYRVVLAKSENGNWILTAYDNSKPREEKQKNASSTTPQVLPSKEQDNLSGVGVSHQSGTQSNGKGTTNSANVQVPAPNIDTMSSAELGVATVEYMGGDRATAVAYLEAERDKADKEVKRLAKQSVKNYTDIADFKRQNDQLQAAKKAAADRYNKLQNAITAANHTDGAYIQALADNAGNFGFTAEQVAGMQHPRVYMQTDEDLPYNTTTFAKFNAQKKKSQGSTNRAVSSSKKLTDAARDGMLRILDNYGTLDAFFASETGAKDIVRSLLDNGIITQQEVAGLTENTDRGFVLSPAGKDYVTDLLIGGLFDEQTIRMLGNDKGLKQSILRAMPSIIENRRLGDYALTDNINGAIRLLYEARQAGVAYPLYIRQVDAFEGKVSDRFSPFEMLLAEEMSSGVENFRQVLNLYNNSARDDANGQTGLFEPRTIEDIKNEILQHYANRKQQPTAAAEPTTRPANPQTQSPLPSTPTGARQGQYATDIPASNILEQIEAEAEPFEEIELTPGNWYALFGEDGIVSTPIGYVKMGEHQYLKLAQKGRDGKLGMIKPTLEHPSVVVMDKSQAKDGQTTEREFSYVFVKAFVGKNGERLYYFTSITVSKDGQEVVVSNQEKERSRIQRLLKNGKLAYINKATLPPASDKTIQGDQLTNPVGEEATVWSLPAVSSSTSPETTEVNNGSDKGTNRASGNSSQTSSAHKGTNNIPNPQASEQKRAENLLNASQIAEEVNRISNTALSIDDSRVSTEQLAELQALYIAWQNTTEENQSENYTRLKDKVTELSDQQYFTMRNMDELTTRIDEELGGRADRKSGYAAVRYLLTNNPELAREFLRQNNINGTEELKNWCAKRQSKLRAGKGKEAREATAQANVAAILGMAHRAAEEERQTEQQATESAAQSNNSHSDNHRRNSEGTPKDEQSKNQRLEQERRERILREGTGFDKAFGLVAPKDITSPQQITDNIEAIVRGLALAEKALGEKGNINAADITHPLSNYNGWVYGEGHIANARHQIEGYLQSLDVLDPAILREWQKQLGIKTYGDLRNYIEKVYNKTKAAQIAELEADLGKPLSLDDKKKLIRNISDGKTKVVLVTNKNIVKKLVELGATRKTIADVAAALSRGEKVNGFCGKGMVILNTDALQTGNDIIATYIHERQHLLTAANPQLLSAITGNTTADELAQILRTITGTTFYDQYNNGTTHGHTALADELISHVMQEAYATGRDAAEIAKGYGITNETILQTLNNIDYEQRQSNSLSKARRDNILGRNTQSSSRQSGGNNQTQSQGGLVQQGARPAGKGSSGTTSRGQTAERGIDETTIPFSVGNAGDNLYKSLKGSTFAGGKSRVPKAELAAAYTDMFRKQAQGQFPDGNGFAYSANYFHKFNNGRIVQSVFIDGNENLIDKIQQKYGIDSSTRPTDTNVERPQGSHRPSHSDDGLSPRQRSGNERVDRLHRAEQPDSAPNNQKINRDKQSGRATELTDPRFSVGTTLETDKTLTEEARKEMQAIAKQAKTDGTFMQAPNGKPSNLNERQWLQVRTRAFKNWFGDWEKSARIEKLRNSKPAVITGSEFDITDNPKKAAIEYGKKLQGYYTNKDTGTVIQLQRGRRNGGINEVLQHNYKDIPHIQSVAAIPQIIEKSTFIDSKLNNDIEKNPSVVSYDHYVCGLKIGDADYTVHALIAMDSKGNRYYDHNLVQIEKKKLLDEIQQATSNGDFGTTPDTKSTISNSDRKVTELFSILQTNSSKCVDSNGEPLVVYHGTREKFNAFRKGYFSFFSSNKEVADVWGNTNDAEERYRGRIINAFVALKNPYVIDANHTSWDRLKYADGKKGDTIDVSRYALQNGYDGVIIYNISEGYKRGDNIIAFSPSQIKSATSNNGSFSENSDDIRFSIVGERNTPEAQYTELDYDTDNLTDAQQLATDAVLGALDDAGISVERVSEEQAEREVEKEKSDSNVRLMLQMEQGTLGLSYHPIAGAKVAKNLETAKNNYTNLSNSTKNAISDIAKALGARNTGTSNYITIEAKNGTIFTLRLSNHNATVANFDNNGETKGISIVISRHDNKGVSNNGNAHIVEYFYPQMALVKAEGTPIADIIGALEQTMYSGEYTDPTGLAQRQEVNIPAEPLRTSNGTIYGYAKDGKIYLTDRGFNPNTPIHEYTHLWVKAMQAKNPQGWQSIVGLLKGTPMWDEVANDPHYSHLTDDNAIASEVLSRYSGSRGAQLFEQKSKEVLEQNPSISAFARVRVLLNNVREALNKFWNWVGKDLFHIDHFDSIEEVSDRILYDLTNGTDLGTDIKDGVAEMQIAPLPKKDGESIADYARRMVDYQNSFAIDQAAQKAQFEYEKHINEQHSALRKLEKGVTDFAKPIMSFQEYMVKQGAVMDIDSDTYQDIWRAGSRTQTAINKYHRECEEPLANTVKSIVNSKKLDNLGFVWQNLPYDTLKKDKDQMNGTAITPRRVIGLYLQAKDCEEALQLGLVDRGAAGFEQNVCLPNVEGYERGVPYTKIIEMVEDALGKDMVDILWKRVRAAVDYGLDYQVKRGMISKDTRNKYKREFYVPQRGWEERDMSGLATDYQRAGGALYGSPYNSALKQAKGRTSLAADPFAYITSIAYSSITSADDNVTRQHLLKFCLDNEELGLQSGAFRIKKFWVVREMDADGNVIGEPTISYAQPTEKMYEHDKEINAKLGTIRKQLGELNRLESQWQSVVEIENINDVVREAVNKKLQSIREGKANLETEAETLNSQLCVLNSRSTDGFNLQLSEDEIGDLTKLDQDTHRTKAELNQHVIYVEHNGQKYALLFKNEQIPNALNKTYKSSLMEVPFISEAARRATRLISATLTQYNPEFAARNYIKDRQTAITTLSVEQGAKFTAKFEANLNSPLLNAAVMQYAFNDNVRDRGKVSGKYKELLNEYFEHGAQTGYSFLPDLQRVRQDFDKLLKNNNAKEFGKATINMLSVLTEASETSIRFAAYVTARESGMSADAAASLSKELTTNFDRHGEWSNSALMSLYSFMRATINGNLKYLRGFKKFPVGFSLAAAAYYAAGVLCSLLNPNDPDNDIWFTDYVRETNITLGKFLGITAKIPLGHFMVMFYAAGVNTIAGVRGNKSAGEAIFDTMQMASNELLPSWMNFMSGATYDTNTGMGFDATQFAQSAAPSVVSPFVDVWLNRNFMGGRINNEYDWNKDEKDILKYKSGTSQFYIDMANGLYEAVGGDLKVKNKLDDNTIQKLVDVSPSTTEYIVEGYSPAIAETILQTAAVIQSAAQGADITADELPLVRKFYSSYRPERAAAQQYYMLKSRSKDYSDLLKEYQKKDPNKYNSERVKGKVDLNERTQRALKRINLDSPSNADIKTLMELNREWNKIE